MAVIEKKEYTEDSTPEEIEMLRNEVKRIGDDIIFYKEAPVMSLFQIKVMWERIDEMMEAGSKCFLMVDLSNSKPPSAEQRGGLKEYALKVSDRIVMTTVYTGKNRLINLVAKFVLAGAGFKNSVICKNKEEAMAEIENYRKKN